MATLLARAFGRLLQSGDGLQQSKLGPGCLAAAQRARYGNEDTCRAPQDAPSRRMVAWSPLESPWAVITASAR